MSKVFHNLIIRGGRCHRTKTLTRPGPSHGTKYRPFPIVVEPRFVLSWPERAWGEGGNLLRYSRKEGANMMDHAFHHVDGRSALRLLWRTLESWFFSVFAGFLLIVIRQNILPPAGRPWHRRPPGCPDISRGRDCHRDDLHPRDSRSAVLPAMSVGRGRLGSVECSRSSSVQPLDPRTVCDAVLCGGTSGGFHG